MITTPLWWAFLLVSPLLYWLLPDKLRAGTLAIMSFGLLMIYAPVDIGLMALLASAVYYAHYVAEGYYRVPAILIHLARSPWPVLIVLIYFFCFKYLPSLMQIFGQHLSVLDFAVPLGISYFSFKLLHYTIERGRGTLPNHGFVDFASYMFLAPIFTAGPIERFEHYLHHRENSFKIDFVFEGLVRIGHGLVKKFVLGTLVFNLLTRVSGGDFLDILNNINSMSPGQIWAALYLSLLYSYLDFSAYSDIAIGSSRLFGLRISENFNLPFLSRNLREFWQRWHMTLASWVLTYIYMPVVGRTRNPYISILVTFAVVGLWHVAWPLHWLLWGLWHGFGLVILIWWGRFLQKRKYKFMKTKFGHVLGWIITMSYVALSEVFPALYGQASSSNSCIDSNSNSCENIIV